MGARQKPAPFPTREDILRFIEQSSGPVGKREIARAFHLDSAQKAPLKLFLREMEQEGSLERVRGRKYVKTGTLGSMMIVEITGTDVDGEVVARPVDWKGTGKPPLIYMAPERKGHPALGERDRVLARITPVGKGVYEGRTIRRIEAAPSYALGVFEQVGAGGRLRPTDRRARGEFIVPPGETKGARNGDLVRAEVLPGRALGLRHARVVEVLHEKGGPRFVSLVSIHDHDIPTEFSNEALALAAKAGPVSGEGREDLRSVPLVTIDGEDARDFDDAVFAEADPENAGGWHLVVAIADVAWYVRPGDALDRVATERGNSVYFPDRVVPMLPEALSNGWCSLVPNEERGCLAAHLWIDAEGRLRRHRVARAIMRSAARLTYNDVQAAHDGNPAGLSPAALAVIPPLYGAFGALMRDRERRGVLELDLPERKVVLNAAGAVDRIDMRPRHDSHRLIEEFMIAANVAAAVTLESLREPCMYRVHDRPAPEKLESLRNFLESLSLGVTLARGQVIKPAHFNRIIQKVAGTPHAILVNEIILRSQAQATYSPMNIGHFGLALRRYCHFTSPIRRYADLLVHRALIRGLAAGEGALPDTPLDLAHMGDHLSATERRAAQAERDAVDRFTAMFLRDRVGEKFTGRINGVTRFGLFVTLDQIGGSGLVPIRTLPDDYYVHDEAKHTLVGRRSSRQYRLGDVIEVILVEADPLTGSLLLNILEEGGENRSRGRSMHPMRPKGRPGKRRDKRRGRR